MPAQAPRAPETPLAERVRPQSLAQMIGNPEAIAQLQKWAAGWASAQGPPRWRAAILAGPAGVGKTTAAVALAHDMGWGLVEMNASDARNRRAIEQVAGRTSLTDTFSVSGEVLSSRKGQHTLILLDEADCLFARDTEGSSSEPAPPMSFRDFVRSRYGSLDALAAAWGLGVGTAPAAFAEWTDIPASGGRSKALRLPAAQRDLADWSQSKSRPDLTDRGGLGAIAKLVRETHQPIVLTVNDPDTLTRYSPLFRSGVARISFWPLREPDLRSAIRRVASAEHLRIPTELAEAVAKRSRGDLRAALNDLDALSVLGPGPTHEGLLGTRDATTDFFDFTREVFDAPRLYRSVEVRNRLDATPDDLLPWMEENLPRATSDAGARLAGYEALADADLLLSRARRFRAYGLWSYASEVMTGGVSLALVPAGGHAPDRVAFPQFLGQMGRSRVTRALRASIVAKAGKMLHMSRRKAGDSALDFLLLAFRRPSAGPSASRELAFAKRLVAALSLTAEEVAYLVAGSPDDARVQRLLSPDEEEEGLEDGPTKPGPASRPDPALDALAPSPPPTRQRRLGEF